MEADRKAVFAWLVAQPDTAWFDTADVAAGSGVGLARVYEALRALEQVGYVTGYYGGSGPLMYYASTKARRMAGADVTLCALPDCNGPSVLRREHGRGGEYAPEVRLICVACGHGWPGSDADVARNEAAAKAWKAVPK